VRRRSGGIIVLQSAGEYTKPELGVVAGKGVGNAVRRNRAKRRLREAAQHVGLRPNTAYVVVASPDVLDAQFSEVTGWLESAVVSGGSAHGDKI
jgi:ribonuclease P protein component